ncbi:hypothetical protein ABW21_db0206256 [Orbilia brochopaga]|nr:hypothetical protein ABW21_db0206256 [Drechslerella brochopaga]
MVENRVYRASKASALMPLKKSPMAEGKVSSRGLPVVDGSKTQDSATETEESTEALLLLAVGRLFSALVGLSPKSGGSIQVSRDLIDGYLYFFYGPYIRLRWSAARSGPRVGVFSDISRAPTDCGSTRTFIPYWYVAGGRVDDKRR